MGRIIVPRKRPSAFWHAHAHTRFSSIDAMTELDEMAEKAKRMGQPGFATTDHGNMSATVQGYKAAKKHGLQYFPGTEGYLVENVQDVKAPRYHIGIVALTHRGYQALAKLSSLSHRRENFHRFPRFDFTHLAELAEDSAVDEIAVMTGCYFGLIQQTLVHQGYDAAKAVLEMYARWFPNLYVELQNHNIDHSEGAHASEWSDESISDALVEMADTLGLPVIITQDSHYLDSKDKPAHNMMKRMVYGGNEGENEFPGDSFHFATTEWVQEHHDPKHWRKAEESFRNLLDMHDLAFPALDTYKVHIPSTVKNPTRKLRQLVYAGLDRLEGLGKLKRVRKRYEERLEHELEVINVLNMAAYFMTWTEVIEWCDDNNVAREARGSSNGSLVCYMLGITSIDPLQWSLLFERFLSVDRIKPPDVDMDVEDRRRPDLIEFLQSRFGVAQIGTFAQLGAREGDDRGSVLVSYNAYLRTRYDREYGDGKRGSGAAKFNYDFGPGGVERIADVKQIDRKEYRGLRQLSKHKVTKSYGVHPAGLLMNGDDQSIEEYVPTMLVPSSKTMVSQFIGDDVEELGYLKKDILGQRTLTAMVRTQELIIEAYDTEAMGMSKDSHDFTWIPLDDRKACGLLREGRTGTGIFQFEGYTMAKGGRELKIRTTNDAIIAQALFRPACIESGMKDLYIQRRNNPELRKNIWYPHPAFEEVLKQTYGVVLFQEQVLEIMRRLGLSIPDINVFFKIVKDSGKGATERNIGRAAEVKKRWQDICDQNDIDDTEAAWRFIEGYTQYGFNKAHSAGYGVRSYRAAFLKAHFPLEFMAANLETVAGSGKAEETYIREARHNKIRILSPDVNVSDIYWTLDRERGGVRKGLLSIRDVGKMSAQHIADNAPYSSLEDLIERNTGHTIRGGRKYLETGEWSSGLLGLREAGALSSLGIRKHD